MRRQTLKKSARWPLVVVAALAVALAGFELTEREATDDAAAGASEPAVVEPIAGTGLSRVKLSASAAERIGLETEPVRARAGRKLVPYSAVLYDERGKTWVYANTAHLTFVRAPVTVASIRGVEALLSAGPRVGTEVVSIAAAELYGAESGVDH